MYPADRKYSDSHEWIRLEGGDGAVGITDYAQQQLGDVVFVELPDVGRTVARGEVFGTVESVKAVSELYAPVGGRVVAVNDELRQHPERLNQAPHDTWIIRVAVNAGEDSTLLTSEQYDALLE